MGTEPLVAEVTEVTSWRERAEAAEQRLAEAEDRIEKLVEQVAVLSRMLFGRSSEKGPGGSGASGGQAEADSGEADGDRAKRGQRPGSKGHGRRDYSRLDTREEVHDVPPDQRVCPDCGRVLAVAERADDGVVEDADVVTMGEVLAGGSSAS